MPGKCVVGSLPQNTCSDNSTGFGCTRITISYSSLCSYYGKVFKVLVPCQQGHTPGEQTNRFSHRWQVCISKSQIRLQNNQHYLLMTIQHSLIGLQRYIRSQKGNALYFTADIEYLILTTNSLGKGCFPKPIVHSDFSM